MERIEISYRTIIFTVLFLIFIWFLYQVRTIILLLFVSLILMCAMVDIIDWLEKNKIPRLLGILLIYFFVICGLIGIIYLIIPPVVEQTGNFLNTLPQLLKDIGFIENIKPDMIISELGSIPISVLRFALSAFSNILGIFTVFVLTFYSLLEIKNIPLYLEALFKNKEKEEMVLRIIRKIESNIGGWVRGEFLLMLIIGVASYIGYRILGLDYPLALAVIAGFMELVPNIGPVISAIPAILVGLTISPALGLGALILSIAVHQSENHIIVPQVMKHMAGVNPIITIVCLLIGFKLGGAGGAVLAVPAFLTLRTLISEIYLFRSKTSSQ